MQPEKNKLEIVGRYIQSVIQKYASGHAMEHAYRPDFEILIKELDPDVRPINDPKHSEHGAPDFVFLRDKLIMGYAEAKDVGVDLDKTEKSEQMKRYFGYSNLILTDYLEFRFYKNGESYGETIRIGNIVAGRLVPQPEKYHLLADSLVDFLRGKPEPITSGIKLAQIMGGKARRIRDNVAVYLADPNEKSEELMRVYETVKKLLVHDLSVEKFADMYAQTLVYGLFVARYNDKTPENFSRQEARDLVPATNPFLREFFDHIVGPRFDARLQYIVDELCAVFSVSDVHLLVQKHLRLFVTTSEKDPIIHFYEDFLKEYDAAERKRMGAYYTPTPVVRYIVNQVDRVLREDFGLAKGLADTAKREIMVSYQGMKPVKQQIHRVQILDPAVGTATFLNEIIKRIHLEFIGQEGQWPSYVNNDLLPRLFGFELMMAPYTIAHLKLGMTLQEMGVKEFNQRLGVYLTNTLEEGVKMDGTLFGLGLSQSIAHEAEEAGKIKHEKPIMVIVGNPPYSGVSSNETDYANSLIDKYKVEPGGKEKLKERKHWLNDDYVKFLAFAEEMIDKNGDGVVGMITNHGYLDNPTFRGMRWHLAQTFDSIHVLDLHGNAKKKEVAPDGGKDENVFDIQQGVAVIVAVKMGKKKKGDLARVYHADLYGKRSEKFLKLDQNSIAWDEIDLDKKMYLFKQRNLEGESEYDAGISVSELFKLYNTGIVTMGDSFIVSEEKDKLRKRIQKLITGEYDENTLNAVFGLGKNYAKWVLSNRNKMVFDESKVVPLDYRPFDKRYTYFDNKLVWRHRENVMQHFLRGENVGLVFRRQQLPERQSYYFLSKGIIADGFIRSDNKGGETVAPLYLYQANGSRVANFDQGIMTEFLVNLKSLYQPEDILDYIYAVLHSPQYREKYKVFLKSDFPRVPVPKNDEEFTRLVGLGRELRGLHLLTSPKVNQFITTYPKAGSNNVEKVEYRDGNVYVNLEQYFGGVPQVAWDFYVGGYQPAQKWLKDRKGRGLSNEDISHYQQMIVALAETDRIMKEIG